jgi:putative mRNA 3-end processing factor
LSKKRDNTILILKKEGLYCPAGDFYIDPRGQVKRALITHAHSDHARSGHENYLCSDSCRPLLQIRIGQKNKIESIPFGKKQTIQDAIVSFHPAGHILGSSQIRIEVLGRVWVVSGDYKPQADRTCEPFELVSCDGFISECTFGLPVYHWQPEEEIYDQINQWWKHNKDSGQGSLVFAYSLGKAQRILAGLDPSIGLIYAHSAVHPFLEHYQNAGISLPEIKKIEQGTVIADGMVIAPPAVEDSSWMKKFRRVKRGFASGWMAIRGPRRRKNIDRGFVLSDHADWPGLIDVITGTGAEVVKLTHGNGDALSRFLGEKGINASVFNESSFREEELD